MRDFDLGFLIGTNLDRHGKPLIAHYDEEELRWVVEIPGGGTRESVTKSPTTYRFTERKQVTEFLYGVWP
mgnify:FL=1